jgi:hypothetical protein
MYNFSRFCGKLFTGVHHIYTYTKNTNRYQNIDIDTDIESQLTPKSTFQKFKEMCKKKWYQLFNKSSPEVILKYETVFPLVETTTLHNSSRYQPNSSGYQSNSSGYQSNLSGYQPNSSRYQPNSSRYQPNSSGYQPNSSNYSESNSVLEKQLFDRKIDELMDEDSLYYDSNYQSVSLLTDNFDPLNAISDRMDELDKEEKLGVIGSKNKKIRFNAEYESSISESSISEYESNSESEPLFHKQLLKS